MVPAIDSPLRSRVSSGSLPRQANADQRRDPQRPITSAHRCRVGRKVIGMDLAQIRAFLTLCEESHFGRTAERLHVSQPRVSRLLAALENKIGAALFQRTSHRVTLT